MLEALPLDERLYIWNLVRASRDDDDLDRAGAGDQGMMFGYATRETSALMPMPIQIAHTLADADHFATMDLTAADIPGLPGTGVTVKFGLIESPQTKVGPPKDSSGTYLTVAHTGQVKLLIELNVPVILAGGLITLSVKVPYYLEGASAEAKLDTLTWSGIRANPRLNEKS